MANTTNNVTLTNRSTGRVGYELPEMKVKRAFNPGETKTVTIKELNALWQSSGGAILIQNDLVVSDKEWCKERWDVPIEYFWGYDEVRKCLLEDPLDLFSETIDFAPGGVRELIKQAAWQLPLADLNKMKVIEDKLKFNVQAAIAIMSEKKLSPTSKGKTRLRKEE